MALLREDGIILSKRSHHGKDESSGEDDVDDQCTRDGCGTGSEAAAVASGSGKGPGLCGSKTGATGDEGTVDGDAAGGILELRGCKSLVL